MNEEKGVVLCNLQTQNIEHLIGKTKTEIGKTKK